MWQFTRSHIFALITLFGAFFHLSGVAVHSVSAQQKKTETVNADVGVKATKPGDSVGDVVFGLLRFSTSTYRKIIGPAQEVDGMFRELPRDGVVQQVFSRSAITRADDILGSAEFLRLTPCETSQDPSTFVFLDLEHLNDGGIRTKEWPGKLQILESKVVRENRILKTSVELPESTEVREISIELPLKSSEKAFASAVIMRGKGENVWMLTVRHKNDGTPASQSLWQSGPEYKLTGPPNDKGLNTRPVKRVYTAPATSVEHHEGIRISSHREFELNGSTNVLHSTAGETWILKCAKRVASVADFNADVLKISPQTPDRLLATMLKEGVTAITVIDEDEEAHRLEVFVSGGDHGLSLSLKRLYPDVKVEVIPINGSVLLRGRVTGIRNQHVVQVAEQFFPTVLNHMTVVSGSDRSSANGADRGVRSQRHVESGILTLQKTRRYNVKEHDNPPLFLARDVNYTFGFPARIISITGFDAKAVTVNPVSGDPASVNVTAAKGNSRLEFVDENKQRYVVEVYAESFDSCRTLTVLAKRIYPSLSLEFIPLQGAILLRGVVDTRGQMNELVELAEEYAPCVLNQLTCKAAGKTPRHPMPQTESPFDFSRMRPSHTPYPDVKERPLPAANTPVVNSNGQILPRANGAVDDENAVRRRVSRKESIRAEIKALHDDVRELIALLVSRKNSAPAILPRQQ